MESSIARVYLLDVPFHVDRPYDYNIPPELRGDVKVGSFVCVPFGGGNRKQLALVGELDCVAEYDKLKPIFSVVCDCITLSAEQLGIIMYMKEYTFCTTGDAVGALLPPSILTKMKEYYSLADPSAPLPAGLNQHQTLVYHFLSSYGKVTERKITKDLGQWAVEIVKNLCKVGIAVKETEFSGFSNIKTVEYASLAVSIDEAESIACLMRAPKQAELLRLLISDGTKNVAELKNEYKFSTAQIKALEKRGAVKLEKKEVFRDPYASEDFQGKRESLKLSKEQTRVKEEICSYLNKKEAHAVLFRGVTGSGKTSVIKSVMDEVIASGRGVIMLVPEIALTPQTVSIFRSYYGDKAVVVHSQLSAGERYDVWKKISSGEALICIGTRSAVFAPFKNLGLIVIDEEQEHTYKSDMSPRYHARDVARFRAAYNKAVMLLASATPSLESYYKAKNNVYTLVELKERYGNAVLPQTKISDLRLDLAKTSGLSVIGESLYKAMTESLERKEQVILFINRRGYNNFVSCAMCGKAIICPKCSVSMTFHSPGRVFAEDGESAMQARVKNGWLTCHYCGTREKVPSVCPECGSEHIQHLGFGTQKVEEELKLLFPDKKVMRMDADTTSTKFAFDNMLERFRNGEADILLGTQMVTKGHDFPNVTCVGVVLADASLYLDDYRANERTFDLITQVTGRAGRSDKKGCAVIQTYNPEHEILRYASMQNYVDFYNNEILLRRSYVFPPFCDVLLINLSSASENELLKGCVFLNSTIKDMADKIENMEEKSSLALNVFGPFEASVYKVNDKYRMQFVVKCKNNSVTRMFFAKIYALCERQFGGKIQITLDMNSNNI